MDQTSYITRLGSEVDSLALIGGKARSLTRLERAGFEVPAGFHVTTHAYSSFVSAHGLLQQILDQAKPIAVEGRASFTHAASNVQKLFDEHELPSSVVDAITSAVNELPPNSGLVVRSSANAEDLPDMSFAGQQDTFLNVNGVAEVVARVRDCWKSLWNERALAYRHRMGVANSDVQMAVVVQVMVPSEKSGILFTANPSTGERSEMILNASYGLGEAVVSGQVSADSYVIDRPNRSVKELIVGAKELQILPTGDSGTQTVQVDDETRSQSSLNDGEVNQLIEVALQIEAVMEDVPQDIEWAFADGKLWLLQSRPITNLPVQPIELKWESPPPARILYRRQIVENMPDPLCPLFDELYLTKGLQSAHDPDRWKAMMDGPLFMTLNGFAFQRADWKTVEIPEVMQEDPELEKRWHENVVKMRKTADENPKAIEMANDDLEMFLNTLSNDELSDFKAVVATRDQETLAMDLTMPKSLNPTYVANNKVANNERQIREWREDAVPRLTKVRAKWSKVDPIQASDEELLSGIREMGIAEGYYWAGNTSHTFGVAKSTDDQLQCFLAENATEANLISGQFLSGVKSKTMQANEDLFQIAKLVRAQPLLCDLVIVTPSDRLYTELRDAPNTEEIIGAVDTYLEEWGHQGYSLDFVEPTQIEEPSALFETLKMMVADESYDPQNHHVVATQQRDKALAKAESVLSDFEYWQFRYRLWFALKYNHIREETAYYFGYTWTLLRGFAFELGARLVDVGTLQIASDLFFLTTSQIEEAIEARARSTAMPELGKHARAQWELREARKRHHPPGTIPPEASHIPSVKFKETQIQNDDDSDVIRGFAVSPGEVTAKASVVMSPQEFGKMSPGTILVAPLTTPAWTQLFSHAVGLVTDIGSILAHGSIVAREYGIPAVLGVGNGTLRIKHGQLITINGSSGEVRLHDELEEVA